MKKNLIIFLVITMALSSASFYVGTKYSDRPGERRFFSGGFQNFSPEERQNLSGNIDAFRNSGGERRGGIGIVIGEIISVDDGSITVKNQNGGSKIIFFSTSTAISKTAEGKTSDLVNGASIIVNGKPNSDGSFTAANIQLKPPPNF